MSFAPELAERVTRSVRWCVQSCRVHRGRGSSAWQSPFIHPLGTWSLPYPETTGYLIPTLYDYLDWQADSRFQNACASQSRLREQDRISTEVHELLPVLVDWLLSLQLRGGAFPAGLCAGPGAFYRSTRSYMLRRPNKPQASTFNSAQVLRGLLAHHRHVGDRRVFEAAGDCIDFLMSSIDDDGSWSMDAHAASSSPAYFAFAVPPLLEVSSMLGRDEIRDRALRALRHVVAKADPRTGFIDAAGFQGHSFAHTHTIAYTLQGLLQSAQILGGEGSEFAAVALRAVERLFHISEVAKRMPGGFGCGWRPDWSYDCVTGDCQIGICYLHAFELTGDPRYLNAACRLYSNVSEVQRRNGALPGSRPIWGKYMTLRWPNWTVKFFLDLVFMLHKALVAEWERTGSESGAR